MLARPHRRDPRDGTVVGHLRGQRLPRGAAMPGWGGAFLTACFPSWLALFRSESQLCLQPVLATYTLEHHGSAPAGSCAGHPPARLQGRDLGGVSLPWRLAGSIPFPFRPAPVNHLDGFFPPKLNKTWMLSSLSLGRRCSQKGLALDLPLCNKKQNLACFWDWEGMQYPSAELGT